MYIYNNNHHLYISETKMSHFIFFLKHFGNKNVTFFKKFFKTFRKQKCHIFYLFLRHFGNKNVTVYFLFLRHFGNKNATVHIIFETIFICAGLPVCDNAKSVRVKLICCPGATSMSQGQSGDPQRPLSVIRLGNTPL